MTQGETYDYRVKANNIGGDSNYSNVLNVVVPPEPVPTIPLNLTADVVTHVSISLSWDDSSLETSYQVMRRDNDAGSFNPIGSALAADTTTYVDNPLSPFTKYEYQVVAINSLG